MIKDIKYSGYSTQPSDYECPDGTLSLSLNLINEEGSVTGIPSPYVAGQILDGYHALFIHRNTGYEHLILYNGSSLAYCDLSGQGSQPIGVAGQTISGLSHINAVGNTLMAFCEDAIYYLLWRDDSYIYLGNQLPEIAISFGLVGHPRSLAKCIKRDMPNFRLTDGEYHDLENNGFLFDDNNEDTHECQNDMTSTVMAHLNRFIADQTVNKGRFCFPFFLRYAIRLFDGSLVRHSAPVLMCPSSKAAPYVFFNTGHMDGPDNKRYYSYDIFTVAADIDYKIIGLDPEKLALWKDIIRSVDVFASKPIYTYDQNGKIKGFKAGAPMESSFVGRLYQESGTRPDERTPDDWAVLPEPEGWTGVNSHTSVYAEWKYSDIFRIYFDRQGVDGYSLILDEFSEDRMRDEITSCANFYLLHSFDFDQLQTDAVVEARKKIEIADDYLPSLVTREAMTDDYLTNDRLAATSSQSYNSRINISGVKRYPFRGFRPDVCFPFTNSGWAVVHFPTESTDLAKVAPTITRAGYTTLRIETYLHEDNKTILCRGPEANTAPYFTSGSAWGNFLFYPNTHVTKMTVYDMNMLRSHTATPEKHAFLNGSFIFYGFDSERSQNAPNHPAAQTDVPVSLPNKIYTSEVNNPFYFPLNGINTVGTGRIIAIATAAKALSQGQFGQFPLYAFTDEGVWALEVSATGSYSARQPITRDVILKDTQPLQMDSAVLFATDRGIMLISGSQTQCITDVINASAPFDVLTLPGMKKLHAAIGHGDDTCLPTDPFLTFISGCGMLYDYIHQRVVIYNPAYTYAYVYSLKSQLWGMMYSEIKQGLNSYPDAIAVDKSNNLLNLSEDGASVKGLLVTRPLKLDAADVMKTVNTVIQRGHFKRGTVQTALYGSRDLIHWHLVQSSRDHYLRGFSGTPYKYFRIACLADLPDGRSLYGATVQFVPKLSDKPR